MKKVLHTLSTDLIAGVVVFLVALPLCLGIAHASGVDPFSGLISGIIGGLVVALLSGSSLSVSGPAAGLIVIVVDAIARLGSFSAFLTAIVVSGVIQIVLGFLKAGKLANYIPSTVIKGMLAAIGILLIIKQLPVAVGFKSEILPQSLGVLSTQWGSFSLPALGLSIISLILLFSWDSSFIRRIPLLKSLPAPLIVVLLGILTTLTLGAVYPELAFTKDHLVEVPVLYSWDAFKNVLTLPDFNQLSNINVWSVAVTLAIVASLETLLSLEAVEELDPKKQKVAPNQELKAQGTGNFIAGLLGGLPITSVIVRSSANINAGAQSRLSAFTHGVLLLLSIFVLSSVINLIPLASLAAILLATGYKLAKPALFISIARDGWYRFIPFIVTIVGVVGVDLLMGIIYGISASVLLAVLSNLQNTFTFVKYDDHFLLIFRKDISFLAKVQLKHYLHSVPAFSTLIIDAGKADSIDQDIYEIIENYIVREAKSKNIKVEKRNIHPEKRPNTLIPKWDIEPLIN
ncbi:MAG: SulP family inorganic anion transporter [Pseudomonadota bacterium]